MKKDIDTIKVKRESVRIWLGVGLAVFGCLLIIAGVCIPPMGVIDGSVLTATGEIFGLSGASMGIFAYNRRDNAKIDYMYSHFEEYNRRGIDDDVERRNNDYNNTEDGAAFYNNEENVERYGTSAEEDVQ